MPGLYTGANGLWGGFAGLLYGSTSLSTPPGLLADAAAGFSPASLFANGEQGVWLDNSDFTTLFQDAAGTTPVTGYEQFVGLRLDKSKGLVLGSELVTNGDFSSSTGWVTGTGATISGGKLNLSAASGYVLYRNPVSGVQAGGYYEVTFTVSGYVSGSIRPYLGSTATFGTAVSANGTYTQRFGPAAGGEVGFNSASAFTGAIDDFSVKPVLGNHAYQTTTTARAVLSARYNLLTQTEAFDSVAWTKPNATITPDQAVSPIGTNTADRLAEKNTTATPNAFQVASTNPAGTYAYSCAVKKDTQRYAIVSFAQSGGAYTAACIDLDNGTITKSGVSTGVTAPAVPTSVSLGGGWYRVTVYGTTTAILNSVAVQPSDTGNPTFGAFGDYSYAGNSSNAIYIWGADLRVANESSALPAYQRVGAAVNGTSTSIGTPDYDTVGFPAYLRYDGGDWYQTGSIDFSTGATNPPLGPELVTNGTFDANLNGWSTSNVVWSAGAASFTGSPSLSQSLSTTNGIYYQVSITISGIVGGTLWVRFVGGTASNSNSYGNGTFTFLLRSNGNNTLLIEQYSGTVTAGSIDNISVKALDANYAPDKMSVFAGVRKLTAQDAIVIEQSVDFSANNGTFIVSSGAAAGDYFGARGTSVGSYNSPFVAPQTTVQSVQYNIGGAVLSDEIIPRINAIITQTNPFGGSVGTGNYGNYPLYIGARAGTSLFYTGRDYGFVIVGRAVTASELTNTEDYMDVQTFGKNMTLVYSDELTTATGDLITAADGDQIYMTVQYV